MSEHIELQPPRVWCLAGPTASGKTSLALALAEKIDLEIISVDSTLVYRGFDLGAAKPSAIERAMVPHHLIDIRDPAETYDAGSFVVDAVRLAAEITARGRVPLLVGGTMLYFRALLQGLAELPAADPAVRAQIDARAARQGWPALHAQLQRIDPVAAARIHANDAQRIQRALEVHTISGASISDWQARTTRPAPLRFMSRWALWPEDRAWLHARIAARITAMVAAGLWDEVQSLFARGDLTLRTPAMRAVGYRQLASLLQESPKPTREQRAAAELAAIAATRQLAKRQMTWMRADSDWRRVAVGAPHSPQLLAEQIAAQLSKERAAA